MTMDEYLVLEREDAQAEEQLNALQQELVACDQRITQNWGKLNKFTMALGWDGSFIKRHNGWRQLGYEDEKQYRQQKGIGRSTWYKMVGIAERLQHLTREQFLGMTVENAERLSVQPTRVKHDPELIRQAQITTAAEFTEQLLIDQAARENKPVGEVYVTMKWRIRQAQREVIERGLEDWQHEHGIDDEGYALELMIAEYRDRPTLVGFMSESIPRLTQAVTAASSIEEIKALRGVFAQHIQEMAEILRVCCGESGEDEQEM